MRSQCLGPAVVAALAFATPALATTITLSTVSSDEALASDLDASFDFSVSDSTLTLTVTSTGSDFNVNEIYFNASSRVAGLSLISAMHNVAGDVSAAWLPIELGSSPDGFGAFDFGLTDGVGENDANIIEPGEDIVFLFSITGLGGYTDAEFIVENSKGYTGAAKFVNGPGDDSAYGAVPEPLTTWLLAVGVGGLLAAGRRRQA